MSARQKARDLVELAADVDTPDNERVAAAMKLVKLIRKYDLLASPLDGLMASDNETVQAATDIFGRLTDPSLVKSLKKVADQIGRVRQRRRSR
jgi:hypothetical protein